MLEHGSHILDEISFPVLTGEMLFDAVHAAESPSASGFDCWGWNNFRALLVGWFDGLAAILVLVEESGSWPDHLPDAYIVMIAKEGGDVAHRPLSLLPTGFGPDCVAQDVRDLGGHLDTTLRGQAGTLACRMRKEIVQLAAVGALLWGLQVTESGPSALHGAEASPYVPNCNDFFKDCVLFCSMVL